MSFLWSKGNQFFFRLLLSIYFTNVISKLSEYFSSEIHCNPEVTVYQAFFSCQDSLQLYWFKFHLMLASWCSSFATYSICSWEFNLISLPRKCCKYFKRDYCFNRQCQEELDLNFFTTNRNKHCHLISSGFKVINVCFVFSIFFTWKISCRLNYTILC